jgi:hypothetical protein
MACALLIKTIIDMVLISIHPFALRKLFLLIVAFLCFSALCLADPVLMVRRYSARPERFDSPKTSAQIGDQSFDHFGTAVRLSEPDSADLPVTLSEGVRNPACKLRSTISTINSIDEAPVIDLRKI